MAVGERLREERKRLGLTQAMLAQIGEIGLSSLKMYEADVREPGASFFSAIATAGADVLYILTGQRSGVSAPAAVFLSHDEAALLDCYRNSSEEGKDVIERTAHALTLKSAALGALFSGSQSQSQKNVTASGFGSIAAGKNVTIKGNVGNRITYNEGPIHVAMSEKNEK